LQLVKKFPAFRGTRRFITALTSVRHLSLSWASPIQSIYPHPTFCRSILILSTHLRLGLPSGSFPPVSPPRPYTIPSSPIRATCPAHLIPLHFITRTILGEGYRSFSSSLCSLIHSPFTIYTIFLTLPPVQWVPSLSPGVKSGRGVRLTPHPLLAQWSRKSRAIPLLNLWSVRSLQSLGVFKRLQILYYTINVLALRSRGISYTK